MAATLRVVRRPKGSQAPARRFDRLPERVESVAAITAASQPVDDPAKTFRSFIGVSGRNGWQLEAWEMLDLVGELRYYVSWRANSCSRVRLVASEIDPETGLPTGGISEDNSEGQEVAEIVQQIAGGALGQAELIKRSAECLTVPGEHWVAIVTDDKAEEGVDYAFGDDPPMCWYVITREEIKARSDGGVQIELPTGEMHDYNPSLDALFRVWFRRPRRAKEADSPVRATLDSLREIVRTTKKIKNAAKSRLIGNGILFIPQEMSLPSAHAPVAANQPGVPLPEVTGVGAADQLNQLLYNVANAAVKDEDSQAAFIPLIATVPGEYLEKVQHVDIGRDVTDVEIKTRNDAIARLAMGLDVSPERLLGIGSNSNHWSAWQIGDEDVQLHIKPVMELLCGAITDQVLKTVLARRGIDATKYVLWYDAGKLTQDPDKTEEATAARDHYAITNEAYRQYLGLADDDGYDFTTFEGWQQWAAEAVALNPELITTLLPLLPTFVNSLDFPEPQTALPPGQTPQEEDQNNQEPNTEQDAESSDNEASASLMELPAELILVERMLVNRALELAGKRRVNTNTLKARMTGVAAHEYHRRLPPVKEADIPKLINGWDSFLADEAVMRAGVKPGQLREAVLRQIYRELTRPVIDAEVI